MQSGKLDQRITLQSPVKSQANGEIKTTYRAEAVVWAHVLTQRGTEAFEAARTNARQTVRVMIRFRDDVDVTWRFVWEGQAFNITEPPDRSGKRRGELWITGQAVGAR